MSSSSTGLKSVDYEIFGDVQGVFFRKYTEEQARRLGLVGWVKNTAGGTVTGQVQGAAEKVNFMMNWLKSVGSPMSRIDRAHFSNERAISKLDFNNFSTKY
ncbi:acylphosphatase-2-like [Mobula hypostoma]|uniref:acylphosphatase-2-like n=1 Tax=Mobula hypostoma TaxID=723540 RepID=UPI002FC356C9